MGAKLFLITTLTRWEEPPRARHQVAYALAKKHRVVFVAANCAGYPKLKSIRESENLEVIQPCFPVPFRIRYRIPILNRWYQNWLFRKLKRHCGDPVVINFDFTATYLHKYFPQKVYYCNDDHVGLSKRINPGWISRYHEKCEQALAEKAAFCVGTSASLIQKLNRINTNAYEIRLGSPDISAFSIDKSYKKATGLIHAGVVGFLNTIDMNIINFLVSKGDLLVTLVGPIQNSDLKEVSKSDNLRLTGPLTGEALYKEISRFDVGLIPYHLNGVVERTPNKLWQYLALGKPAVITDIEGIRNWEFPEDFIYRSRSPQQFYDLIHTAASSDTEELAEARISFAKENTWDKRMEHFLKLCHRYFN